MKYLATFFMIFAFVAGLYAQSDLFTVVSSKNVVQKKGGSWVNLAVGNKLKSNDVIKANSGGVASFLHSSGKVIKFNQTQETTVSSLEKNISTSGQNSNLAGQLLDITKNKLNRSSSYTTGNVGATRATETVNKDIFLIVPRKENSNPSKVLDEYPLFIWNNVQGEKEYQLIILTEDLDAVKTCIVKDTTYKYSKDDPKLKKGTTYVCIIRPMKSQKMSEYQAFTVVSESELKDMMEKIDFAKNSVNEADDIAKLIIMGTTYEDLGLYSDAYFAYKQAIKLDPQEKAYKKMLADLLSKVNLIKQTYYLTGYLPEK